MKYPQSINKIADTITTILEYQNKIDSVLSDGPASYYLQKMRLYMDVLFNQYAPFQIGSRIRLKKDIGSSLPKDSGWYMYRKMLHEGATGIVKEVDVNASRKFVAGVIFDTEFSVSSQNESVRYYHKDNDKCLFYLSEDDLEICTEPYQIQSDKMVQLELPFEKE
jgi:hypothetical protein